MESSVFEWFEWFKWFKWFRTFENRTIRLPTFKSSVIEWIWNSNVRNLSPDCTQEYKQVEMKDNTHGSGLGVGSLQTRGISTPFL